MEVVSKLCVIVLWSLSVFNSQIAAKKAKDHQWDHFVFSQQWPMSVCIDRNITHQYNCAIPDFVSTWTVHGLWPSQGATEGPVSCNKSAKFNYDQLKSIEKDLQTYWPNLYTDSKPDEFWEHEWMKHGTCAMIQPDLDCELKYFSKGLELGRKYDVFNILNQHNITPADGKAYSYDAVLSALTDGLSQTPKLVCTYDKETKTQYLSEVEFCLDKTFQLIECPTSHSLKFNSAPRKTVPCWNTETLAYPEIKH